MTTLHKVIEEYLETRNNRDERSVLNRFKEYMQKKKPEVQVKDVTLLDFQSFPKSLLVSEVSQKIYASRLKPFQEYIGLFLVTVKKNRNPKNDQSVILELQKELTKTKRDSAGKDERIIARDGTINEQDQTIEKQKAEIKTLTEGRTEECSQCPKTAPLNETIRLTVATLEKERKENKATNDGLKDEIQLLNQGLKIKNNELETKQGEIASLKTDNEYLKRAIEEQSHDKLLEENQYLKVQLGQKDAEIESKEKRIGEVEQLIDTGIKQKGEIVSRVLKMVRDFKAYMPSKNERCNQCVNNFSIEDYRRSAFKSVTNLEDYIKGLCQDT